MGWEVGGFSTHSFKKYHSPTCSLLLLFILFIKLCSSYPNGADIPLRSTCSDMRPDHGNATSQPQESEPGFIIESLNKTFTLGGMISFRVSASSQDNCFTGIYAQVRPDNREIPVGGFPSNFNPDFLTTVSCSNRARSTITQREAKTLCQVNLTWRAPVRRRNLTSVRLFVTIVQSSSRFWVQLKSSPVPLASEITTTPTVATTQSQNTSSNTTLPFSTELSISTRMDSDNTSDSNNTFGTITDPNEEKSMMSSHSSTLVGEDADSSEDESDKKSSRSEDSSRSSESTESPEYIEPTFPTTQTFKTTSQHTTRPSINPTTSRFPTKSSESMQTLQTTTGIFIDDSTPTFLHTLMTLFKTEPDNATATSQTDYRSPTAVTPTEPLDTTEYVQTTTRYHSTSGSTLSSTDEILTTTLNEMPITNDITTKNDSPTTSIIHTDSGSSTPTQSEKPSSYETEFVTTENVLTTPTELATEFSGTSNEGKTTSFSTGMLSTTQSSNSTGMPIIPSSMHNFPSTKESTTQAFPSTIGHSTQYFSTFNPDKTTTIRPTTAERTVPSSIEDTTETHLSKSSKDTSEPMTDQTSLMERTSPITSTETPIFSTLSLTTPEIPMNSMTTHNVPFTMESTTHVLTSTIDHTTKIVLSTNPSTTERVLPTTVMETVSGSTEDTTVLKHTSKPIKDRTTFMDKTSKTSATPQMPISTAHSLTTELITSSQLTSNSLLSTVGHTTEIVPSTNLDTTQTTQPIPSTQLTTSSSVLSTTGHTTEIFPSTNPATTQTNQSTTAGSTKVATEINSSTSSNGTSGPTTDQTTTLMNRTSVTSTQKPTTSTLSTRLATETEEPLEEDFTTDTMEITSEDFTAMDNQTEDTVTPKVQTLSSTKVSTTTTHQSNSSTVRTTQSQTTFVRNLTTVSGESTSTNRQSTQTSSEPSTRRETAMSTEPEVTNTSQDKETTLASGGTKITMVFKIVNYIFNESLTDKNSGFYKLLDSKLATAVKNVYNTLKIKPKRVRARNFENGSVIAEMSTVYEKTLNDDEMTGTVLVMYEHVTNDMFDNSFNISGFWILDANGRRVDVDICFGTNCPPGLVCIPMGNQCVQRCEENPGYCNNHGTCEGYPGNITLSCECDQGFSGGQCEIEMEAQVEMIAVVLGIIGAILLVLIVILMIGMVWLLRTKPKSLLPTSMDNHVIPQFPMIPLRLLDKSTDEDDLDSNSITSDHPSITEEGGVRFPHLPDLITSASSIPDWERDVVSNPNRQRRRRNVSFNDIREVLEGDDTISIETFSFGRSYVSQEEDNGQTIFRWRMESESTPSRDESPT